MYSDFRQLERDIHHLPLPVPALPSDTPSRPPSWEWKKLSGVLPYPQAWPSCRSHGDTIYLYSREDSNYACRSLRVPRHGEGKLEMARLPLLPTQVAAAGIVWHRDSLLLVMPSSDTITTDTTLCFRPSTDGATSGVEEDGRKSGVWERLEFTVPPKYRACSVIVVDDRFLVAAAGAASPACGVLDLDSAPPREWIDLPPLPQLSVYGSLVAT